MDTVTEFLTRDLLDADRRERDAERPCTAELAECTCPDFCERDHANE
jgi:hypothetical protein